MGQVAVASGGAYDGGGATNAGTTSKEANFDTKLLQRRGTSQPTSSVKTSKEVQTRRARRLSIDRIITH